MRTKETGVEDNTNQRLAERLETLATSLSRLLVSDQDVKDLFEAAALARRVEELEARSDYLQREINKMRRVMQDAGTWEQFCFNYADYSIRRGINENHSS